MPIIYHITSRQEWLDAQEEGHYESAALTEEGFIHCSEESQIPGVLERYFRGKKDLVKLRIDTDRLSSPLFYDWSDAIEDTFPHIYGPLNLEAVLEVTGIDGI